MTKLAYLHEPGVLHNLSCRYGLNEIYVSTAAAQRPRPRFSSCPEQLAELLFQAFSLADNAGMADVHREHLDCGEPFPAAASSVWRAHDGAVQGRHLWGAQPPSLRHRRRLLQVRVCSVIAIRISADASSPLNFDRRSSLLLATISGRWSMIMGASPSWWVERVVLVRRRRQRCSWGILHSWEEGRAQRGVLSSNRF